MLTPKITPAAAGAQVLTRSAAAALLRQLRAAAGLSQAQAGQWVRERTRYKALSRQAVSGAEGPAAKWDYARLALLQAYTGHPWQIEPRFVPEG